MIMQSSVENTNSLINIRVLGSFSYTGKCRQIPPYTAIKTRGFGLIDLIGSLIVKWLISYFLFLNFLFAVFKAKSPDSLSGNLPQPVSNQMECRKTSQVQTSFLGQAGTLMSGHKSGIHKTEHYYLPTFYSMYTRNSLGTLTCLTHSFPQNPITQSRLFVQIIYQTNPFLFSFSSPLPLEFLSHLACFFFL